MFDQVRSNFVIYVPHNDRIISVFNNVTMFVEICCSSVNAKTIFTDVMTSYRTESEGVPSFRVCNVGETSADIRRPTSTLHRHPDRTNGNAEPPWKPRLG